MTLTFATLGTLSIAAIVFVLLEFFQEASSSVKLAGGGRNAIASGNLKTLVNSQREPKGRRQTRRTRRKANLAMRAAAEVDLRKRKAGHHARMNLGKKLRYAKWPLSPVQFRAIQGTLCLIGFIPAYLHATIFIQILVVLLTPLLVMAVLDSAVNRRFKAFDLDYPVMLLQYISIMKTGMSAIPGLEAVSKGLERGSIVRAEIRLLIERLRLGLSEEHAISAFGEDIPHPELELFVQSLLIHRKVGGGLSKTLERLARQVRKRQQFRKQAVAAVSMERTSIYAIACILTGLLIYMIYYSPALVLPAFSDQTGNMIFQGGLSLIIFGFYWSRIVTNIKI